MRHDGPHQVYAITQGTITHQSKRPVVAAHAIGTPNENESPSASNTVRHSG